MGLRSRSAMDSIGENPNLWIQVQLLAGSPIRAADVTGNRTGLKSRVSGSKSRAAHHGGIAQWQSSRLLTGRPRVRIPRAPTNLADVLPPSTSAKPSSGCPGSVRSNSASGRSNWRRSRTVERCRPRLARQGNKPAADGVSRHGYARLLRDDANSGDVARAARSPVGDARSSNRRPDQDHLADFAVGVGAVAARREIPDRRRDGLGNVLLHLNGLAEARAAVLGKSRRGRVEFLAVSSSEELVLLHGVDFVGSGEPVNVGPMPDEPIAVRLTKVRKGANPVIREW